MGIGGISMWQLLIVLLIVVLIFGTKRLKNIGGDLGGAMKSFKDAVTDDEKAESSDEQKKSIDDTKAESNQSKTANKEPSKQ